MAQVTQAVTGRAVAVRPGPSVTPTGKEMIVSFPLVSLTLG